MIVVPPLHCGLLLSFVPCVQSWVSGTLSSECFVSSPFHQPHLWPATCDQLPSTSRPSTPSWRLQAADTNPEETPEPLAGQLPGGRSASRPPPKARKAGKQQSQRGSKVLPTQLLDEAAALQLEVEKTNQDLEEARARLYNLPLNSDAWTAERQYMTALQQLKTQLLGSLWAAKQSASQALTSDVDPGGSKQISNEVIEFWRHLTQAKEETVNGTLLDGSLYNATVLTLTGNTSFFGLEEKGARMLVRDSYVMMLADIRRLERPQMKVYIEGNPGIGKSMFGYYLLYHAAREGATIIYDVGISLQRTRFRFSGDSVMEGSTAYFKEDLADPNTWYISDAGAPSIVTAKTVLVASPKPEHSYEFLKYRTTVLTFNIWTWQEIQIAHQQLYFSLDASLVQKNFDRWGGFPRYVLEKGLDPDAQMLLEQAIKICRLKEVIRVHTLDAAPPTVSHKIVHIVREDGRRYVAFNSKYIVHQLWKASLRSDFTEVQRAISVTGRLTTAGSLRGDLFEGWANIMLSKGGTYKVKVCHSNGTETNQTFTMPCLPFTLFDDNLAVYQLTEGEYGIARKPNNPVIDAAVRMADNTLYLFQMTVGVDHGIKHARLMHFLDHNSHNASIVLVFVVPKDIFTSFHRQQFMYGDKVLKNPNATAVAMPQWVLRMDLDERFYKEIRSSQDFFTA